MNKKGFTLIELMVVIAVIGILASVVMVAYPKAQLRAKDGVIMADADQLRTTAEISKDEVGDYSGIEGKGGTTQDTDCKALIDDANTRTSGTFTFHYKNETSGSEDYSSYCGIITLNSGDTWCIDSHYYSGSDSTKQQCAVGKFCDGSDM